MVDSFAAVVLYHDDLDRAAEPFYLIESVVISVLGVPKANWLAAS